MFYLRRQLFLYDGHLELHYSDAPLQPPIHALTRTRLLRLDARAPRQSKKFPAQTLAVKIYYAIIKTVSAWNFLAFIEMLPRHYLEGNYGQWLV